jgi:hypothetical protein
VINGTTAQSNIDEAINLTVKLAYLISGNGYVKLAKYIIQCVDILDEYVKNGEEQQAKDWIEQCCKSVWDRVIPNEEYDIITTEKSKESLQEHTFKQNLMNIFSKVEKCLGCDLTNIVDDRKNKIGDPKKI